MEDTPDKIRRNIVVFSAAIVIGWFLDLKLTAITKLFVSADIDNVNAGRLWIVTLIVLIYLFLRYRFDNLTNSQIFSLLDELKTQRKDYLSKYLLRKINYINRTGKFSPIFGASLSETVNSEKEKYQNESKQNISFHLDISPTLEFEPPSDIQRGGTIWRGRISVLETYFIKGSPRHIATRSGELHNFSVPLHGRIWVEMHAITHIAFYSKSSIELIVPVLLACFALLITICKLITTFSI